MGRKPDLTPEQAEEILLPQTIRAVLGRQGAYRRKHPSKPGDAQ
jgi:hypothetical protein